MNDNSKTAEDKKGKWLLFSNKEQVFAKKEEDEIEKKKQMYLKIDESLKQALRSEHLIVLTGAGSSIGQNKGEGGKSMEELWGAVKAKITEVKFTEILKLVSYNEIDKDLEELLSRLQRAKGVKEDKGEDVKDIGNAIFSIEEIIKTECNFSLPESFPHEIFLNKLLKARKKTSPRLKIFTLNYDTCFEKAGDKIGAVIIDGFSFTQGRKFRSTDFDLDIVQREQTRIHKEENFYNKVLHLYKIHGSVNWEKPKRANEEISKKENPNEALLIYPNSSKFENSYQMPFFEMISRFQIAIRAQNTTLIIVGYGFGDDHINRIIEEALRTNYNLYVIIVNNSIKEDEGSNTFRERLFPFAKNNSGLQLIADTFLNFTNNLPNIESPDKDAERSFRIPSDTSLNTLEE